MSVSPFSLPVSSKVSESHGGLVDLGGADASLNAGSNALQGSAGTSSDFGSLLTDAGLKQTPPPSGGNPATTQAQTPLALGTLPVVGPAGTFLTPPVPLHEETQEGEGTLDTGAGLTGDADGKATESEQTTRDDTGNEDAPVPVLTPSRSRLPGHQGKQPLVAPAMQPAEKTLAAGAKNGPVGEESVSSPEGKDSDEAQLPSSSPTESPTTLSEPVAALCQRTQEQLAAYQTQDRVGEVLKEDSQGKVKASSKPASRLIEGTASGETLTKAYAATRGSTSGQVSGLAQGVESPMVSSYATQVMQGNGPGEQVAAANRPLLSKERQSTSVADQVAFEQTASLAGSTKDAALPVSGADQMRAQALVGQRNTAPAGISPGVADLEALAGGNSASSSLEPDAGAVQNAALATQPGRGLEKTAFKTAAAGSAISSSEPSVAAGGGAETGRSKLVKEFQSVEAQSQAGASKAAGIRNADTMGNMALRRKTQAEAFRSEELFPAAAQPLPAQAVEQAAAVRQQGRAEATDVVQRTLSIVNEVVEKMQVQAGRRVDFDVKLSGEDRVSVNVEYKNGQLHVSFRTDSNELRQALSSEWKHAMSGVESGLRFAEPSFGGGSQQHSRGEAFDMSGGQQGQQQPKAQQQAHEERGSFYSTLSRTDAKDGAKAEGPALRRAQAPDTTRHLNVTA